jgi:hypothetical protein
MALTPTIGDRPGRRRRTKRRLRRFAEGGMYTGIEKPLMRSKDAVAIALSKTDADPKPKRRKKKRKPVLVQQMGTKRHGSV